MNTDDLIAALETALAQIHEVSMTKREKDDLIADMRETLVNHELGERILPILEIQPEFSGKAPMINELNALSGFQSQLVAPILVREARKRQSAKAAVDWLQKVLRTESGIGLFIQTLWGLAPTEKLSLLEDVDLLPFNSLPHSRQKDQLMQTEWLHGARLTVPVFAWEPPSAALIVKKEVRPFLIDASLIEKSPIKERIHPHVLLDEIRLCLAVEGPSIIFPGPSWFQYIDPDLEAALLGAGTSFSHQEVLPIRVPKTSAIDLSGASSLVRAYTELTLSVKSRVHTALTRLHQALTRREPADSALEISIALETLLVNSPGEHTFKIALRAAMLGSDNVEDRMANRAIIEAAYGMRSALMHSGHSATVVTVKGQGKRAAAEVISEAEIITARVIKRIIMKGAPPDWNQFELSDATRWK